jgi:ribosome-associated heat shock protein Hsp15
MDPVRIDKWLWAARLYKTRSLATDEINKGRVLVNQQPVKPARELKVGDKVELRHGVVLCTVIVRALSAQRGPAPVAQQLYEETEASRQAREKAAEERRLGTEPAHSLEQGRPTKRDRRQIDNAWNARWSASLDK